MDIFQYNRRLDFFAKRGVMCRPESCFSAFQSFSFDLVFEFIPWHQLLSGRNLSIAPPQFAKRRVRVTWEAEGWGEGEQNAAQLDSGVTDAGQATSFRSNDQYDDNYYYGSVADTDAAESQQVMYYPRPSGPTVKFHRTCVVCIGRCQVVVCEGMLPVSKPRQ